MLVAVTNIKILLDVFNPKSKLQRVFYIEYPIQVGQWLMQAVIDSSSKIYTMHPDFAKKLGLLV